MSVPIMIVFTSPIPILLQLLVTAESTAAQCVTKYEAAAAFGETVEFRICEPPQTQFHYKKLKITIDPGKWDLVVARDEPPVKGWSWNVANPGGKEYFNISFTPDSPEDYRAYRIFARVNRFNPKSVLAYKHYTYHLVVKVTLNHRGPPELCWKRGRDNPRMVYSLLSPIGSHSNLTMCAVSQSPVKSAIEMLRPLSCDGSHNLGASTLNASADQDPGHPIIYHLVFKVTSMSTDDIGIWAAVFQNLEGRTLLRVEVNDLNAPRCSKNASNTAQVPTRVCLLLAALILVWSLTT